MDQTIHEDPSLMLTHDGRVEAKPIAELRRLYPELPPEIIDTIHREATDAAAAYTAERRPLAPVGVG